MTNEPKTTAERDYQPLPPRYYVVGNESVWNAEQMHAYYDLGREAGAREAEILTDCVLAPRQPTLAMCKAAAAWTDAPTSVYRAMLAASPTAQAAPAANPECEPIDGPIAMPPVTPKQFAADIAEMEAAPAAVAGPSDEMVLAAARIISPNLFRHGLHPLPKDGPKTAMNMRAEAHQVRHMLAAALSAAPQPPAQAQEPFGYVNTHTGQFFKDVEACRRNNEGHWRTVYDHPAPQPAPAALGDAVGFDAADMATAAAQGFRDGQQAALEGL